MKISKYLQNSSVKTESRIGRVRIKLNEQKRSEISKKITDANGW